MTDHISVDYYNANAAEPHTLLDVSVEEAKQLIDDFFFSNSDEPIEIRSSTRSFQLHAPGHAQALRFSREENDITELMTFALPFKEGARQIEGDDPEQFTYIVGETAVSHAA